MKILFILLRVAGVTLAMMSLGAFASDYIPVNGLNFLSWGASDGEHYYFKIVPTNETVNYLLYGILFGFLSFVCFVLPAC
jgi:hypothetical protein